MNEQRKGDFERAVDSLCEGSKETNKATVPCKESQGNQQTNANVKIALEIVGQHKDNQKKT